MPSFTTYHSFVGERPNGLVEGVLEDFPYIRGSALDLGAGNLRDSKFLKRSGFARVVAVDSSEDSLQYATEGIELVIKPIQKYRPEANAFDLVISCNTLFFIAAEEIVQLLSSIHKALRPGGLLAFNVLGEFDPWAGTSGITTFSEPEAMELTRRYIVLVKKDMHQVLQTASGGYKQWHQFLFVLRRP